MTNSPGSSRWPASRLDPAAYVSPGIDLPVFYGDLDTNRHVNNVTFGRFFEHARYQAHRMAGIVALLHENGGGMLVARVTIDYLAEGRLGPPMHVRTRVVEVGHSSMREEQAAWQDGHCVALADITVAYRKDRVAAPWPDTMRAAWESLRVTTVRTVEPE